MRPIPLRPGAKRVGEDPSSAARFGTICPFHQPVRADSVGYGAIPDEEVAIGDPQSLERCRGRGGVTGTGPGSVVHGKRIGLSPGLLGEVEGGGGDVPDRTLGASGGRIDEDLGRLAVPDNGVGRAPARRGEGGRSGVAPPRCERGRRGRRWPSSRRAPRPTGSPWPWSRERPWAPRSRGQRQTHSTHSPRVAPRKRTSSPEEKKAMRRQLPFSATGASLRTSTTVMERADRPTRTAELARWRTVTFRTKASSTRSRLTPNQACSSSA